MFFTNPQTLGKFRWSNFFRRNWRIRYDSSYIHLACFNKPPARWWFQRHFLLFIPNPGEMISNFDFRIFFRWGWNFNHQLVAFWKRLSKLSPDLKITSWRSPISTSADPQFGSWNFLEPWDERYIYYLHLAQIHGFHADRYTSPTHPMVLVKRQWVWFSGNSTFVSDRKDPGKNESK